MAKENDTATVEQETTTEEKGAETTETKESSNDTSQLMEKLDEFGEKINALEGRLNRQTKKETKSKSETPEKTKSDSSELANKVEALSLQVAGITKDSEVELARNLQSETGLPMDKLLNSKYFKTELEELRTQEKNDEATTGVKGDKSGSSNPKQSADYWIAKGEYPTREQVSDRKVRKEIRDAFVAKEKGTTGGFYNS